MGQEVNPLGAELSAFRAVRSPSLRRLAQVFALFKTSEMGAWLAITALAHQFGGVGEAAAVMVAQLLPAAALAPFVGSLGNRLGTRRVLVGGLALQSAALLAIALLVWSDSPPLVIYAVAVLGTLAVVTTRPTLAALLPTAVDDPRQVTAAHAVLGSLDGICTLVGPALTAIGSSALGIAAPFALFGLLNALAAVLALSGRAPAERDPATDGAGGGPRLGESIRSVLGTAGIRPVLIALASYSFAVGAVDLLFVVVGVDIIGGTTATAGWLSTAFGLGTLIGGAIGLAVIPPQRLWPWMAGAGLALAAGLAVTGTLGGSLALPAFILAGAASTLLMVTSRALLQRLADLDVVCHAFALAESSDMTMLLIGTAVVPLIVTGLGSGWAGVGIAAVVLVAMASVIPRLAGAERSAPIAFETVDLLRADPVFSLLGPAELETLARNARPITAPAGTTLIREGELGDRYYVLVSGHVVVTQAGTEINRLGPGDGFGELALLHAARRTATVTAVDEVRLLAVDRGPFVLVVTGHPDAVDLTRRRLDADAARVQD